MTRQVSGGPRSDARGKATGGARYSQDHYPRGMLHGVVVRSPHPKATIARMDLSPACAVSGVVTVLGPDDVPGGLFGDVVHDEPLLARGAVRYAGEPVALVAGETIAAAQAGAAAIAPEYEPQAAVVDLAEAIRPDAPDAVTGEANIGEPSIVERGDVERAFASAHTIVETVITSQRVHQGYIELRCALAEIADDGRLIVTMTSQAPFLVRKTLSRLLDLPMTKVVVRVPAFGGGFGGKLHDGMAPYAAVLALASGRPVQVVSSREEEMQASNPRENSIVKLTSAVTADGHIVGRRCDAYFDSGAYTCDTPYITSMGAMQACGPYAVDAVDAAIYPVRTNTQATGSFRAPSGPQMAFANETHMDDIAERLGLDRLELRRRNFMRPGSSGPTGQVVEAPSIETCLAKVERRVEAWRAEAPVHDAPTRRRGYGIACTWWFVAPSFSGANVKVNEDATVTVFTGATEIGTGAVVMGVVQLVADELGISPDRVSLVCADTDAAPADMGSDGSRTLYGVGNAVLTATSEVTTILAEAAADELEASARDMVFADGRVHVAGSPDRGLAFGDVVTKASADGGPVVGAGRFQSAVVPIEDGCARSMLIPAFNEPTFHCHGVEIEVDAELGSVDVLRYAAAHDTGPIVSAAGVKGQIEGGIVQGIGHALYEEMLVDEDGLTRNGNLVDYRLPTIADLPGEIVILPVEDFPSVNGPRGLKGIGEAPVILPAATLASAIRDALGVRPTELPLTAERIAALVDARSLDTKPV